MQQDEPIALCREFGDPCILWTKPLHFSQLQLCRIKLKLKFALKKTKEFMSL